MTALPALPVPDLAPPQGWLGRARRGAMLLVAAGGDAVSFYGALAIADPNLDDRQVAAAVLALTSATVGLMHFAGVSSRKRRLAGADLRSWSVGTLLVLWLAMGVSALVIRLGGEPVDAGLGLSGAAPAAATGSWLQHAGLPLLMFTLFLGTGGMAAWAAYNGHDPAHERQTALRRARRWVRFRARRAARVQRRQDRRLRRRAALVAGVRRATSACSTGVRRAAVTCAAAAARAVRERKDARVRRAAEQRAALARQEDQRRLQTLEAQERLAHETLTTAVAARGLAADLVQRREDDAARNEQRHAVAHDAVDPWADELRDYARLRLAAALSDPATTTALTAPQLPRPRSHRGDVS